MLLDEPTSALDPEMVSEVLEIMVKLDARHGVQPPLDGQYPSELLPGSREGCARSRAHRILDRQVPALSSSKVEQRLLARGFILPTVTAQGSYAVAIRHGDVVHTAGQLSRLPDGLLSGIAAGEQDLAKAKEACKAAVLRAIAAVRSVAPLDSVSQVLTLRGFIASDASFVSHTQALDAASEVLLSAFGQDIGRHARSAIGVSALPSGGFAEVELVVAVRG